MRVDSTIAAAVCALTLIGFSSAAPAHSNGHESRTVAQCEKLPGTATTGERAICLACVQRNKGGEKFHFHPDYPAGDRCRPDDGKP